MPEIGQLRFPVSYLQVATEICFVRGVHPDALIDEKIGLTPFQRADPRATLTGDQFAALMAFVEAFVTERDEHQRLLLEFFPATVHGNVALAAITSRTLGQALEVALRYAHQVMPAYDLTFETIDSRCLISFRRVAELGAADDLLAELVFCALNSFVRLVGHDTIALDVQFAHSRLVLSELPRLFPNIRVTMGAVDNFLWFPAKLKNSIIATRNEATRRAIEELLEADDARSGRRPRVADRVSRSILRQLRERRPVSATDVASSLGMSARSMSRWLKEEGSSFRSIYNGVRISVARNLLRKRTTHIAEVAEILGFADEANFSRFYTGQTGEPPSRYRARAVNEADG